MKLTVDIKLTDKQIKENLSNLVVLVDTREKKNNHILSYFEQNKIAYEACKLDFGDYSFSLNVDGYTIDFSDKIVIERKQHLDELSSNFTKNRTQFENELLRKKDANFTLLVENNSYSDLIQHNYKSQFNEKSFLATLKTFETRYNINTTFMPDIEYTGNFIYYTGYYFMREYLKS